VIRVSVPKEFSLQRSNAHGQISIRFHRLSLGGFRRNKLHPLLSPFDQPLIGHLPQRFPILLGYGFNNCLQPVAHLRTSGKLNPGSSELLLPTPVEQLMNIGRTIGTNPDPTNSRRQEGDGLLKHPKQIHPCRDIAVPKLIGQNQILFGPVSHHGLIALLPQISHPSFSLMVLNDRGIQINRGLPRCILRSRLPNQVSIHIFQPTEQLRLLRDKGLRGNPTLQDLFLMKGIEEPSDGFGRKDSQPELLQSFILPQQLKILHSLLQLQRQK
jgi:hypothetical protein